MEARGVRTVNYTTLGPTPGLRFQAAQLLLCLPPMLRVCESSISSVCYVLANGNSKACIERIIMGGFSAGKVLPSSRPVPPKL